tara:strand:+ start:3166 stop:4122 length:957 start_codon:yes stop_codon:yes gene_type:complete
MKEIDLISRYLQKLVKNNSGAKNLNDDVFFDKKRKLVISVDTYNEGIHFFDLKKPQLVVKKILRSSISDLICKGVKPEYYFLSFSSKNNLNKFFLKKIINTLNYEQKKYNIKISGGDTCKAKTTSFTVVSIGFSNRIVERNNAKIYDDLYVTGELGDSYVGLKILEGKYKTNNKLKFYFINKYYSPEIPHKYYKIIKKYANTSIDISDGLFDDLKKLINKQNCGYKIFLEKIPISNYLRKFLRNTKKNKLDQIYHGDDYQILFTAKKQFRNQIKKDSKLMNQKVTIIGEISSKKADNLVFYGNKFRNTNKYRGYSHSF